MTEKSIDEYGLFGDAPSDGMHRQPYTITRNHRYIMLFCISFLILNLLKMGVEVFVPDFLGFNAKQNNLISLAFIITSIYYYYFLMNYFKFYQLQLIRRITLVLMITDVLSQLIYLGSSLEMDLNLTLIEGLNNLLSLGFTVIWIALIFRITENYPAIRSLKNAVMALMIVLIISMIVPFLFLLGNVEALKSFINLVYIPLIVPYFFIFGFVLKLKVKESPTHE